MFGWDVIRKGIDLLVSADRNGVLSSCDIRVVCQDVCREYLRAHRTEHIRFLEQVSDVNVLFRECKAFLHVSRAEGMSYALLEVIYAGLPVICSDIPENQVASAFDGIFWVPNENADEIAKQIKSSAVCRPRLQNTLFARTAKPLKRNIRFMRGQGASLRYTH